MTYLRRVALIGAVVSVATCAGGAIAVAIWPHAWPWLTAIIAAGAIGFIVAVFSRRYRYPEISRSAGLTFTAGSPPLQAAWVARPAVPQPIAYDESVRKAFTQLVKPGQLMFNPPDHMQLRHTERVEVRLTRTLELTAELLEHLGGRGEPRLEEILTAPRMAVTLNGDGFRITAFSDEEQSVLKDEITSWEFDIRAVKKGQQHLVMSVSLRIPLSGYVEHKSVPVRESVIDVQVGVPALAWYFVSDYWQRFIGTGIAAAAVVVAVLYH